MNCILFAGFVLLGAGDGPPGDGPSRTKIHSYPRTGSEEAAYTIRIDAPWPGGGQLHVNFPEHLEYGPVGYTITRYHDPRPPAWRVGREGKFAHYEVDSMPGRGVEGVKVRASARVIEPNRVRMSLTIVNDSDKMLRDVKPLLCFQYKDLAGFAGGYEENFRHSYVVLDGRVTALADVPTEKADAAVKAAPIRGVEPYRFDFSKKRGGFIDKPLDLGLSVITSKDSARAVILYAPVGRSVLSNLHIPCLHADPHFGHVRAGETKERIVNVTFAGADWRDEVERIRKQHAAAQEESKPARLKTHRPDVMGPHGLVTAGHPLASMAGVRILMDGGNAADAAVAVLATLNLTEPMMSGAGGNGFMTVYDRESDRVYSLNATGAAPKAIDPSQMTPDELLRGVKAGVVPGLFGGWIALLDRFGTKSLAEVLAPAIEYAENGHPLDRYVATSIARQRSLFERFPSSARVFLLSGRPPEPGETFKYPDLANTFRRVVAAERDALRKGNSRSEALRAAFDRFYTGDIAQQMVSFYEEKGGRLTAEDLAGYEPTWTEPVHTNYRGYDVYTSPPTSRGGLEVVMQLNLIEGYDLERTGHNTAETLHLVTECIKLAKSDVYHFVADPKFANVPTAEMISKEYAAMRREATDLNRAMAYPDHGNPIGPAASRFDSQWKHPPSEDRPPLAERAYGGSTTSFSVVDQSGNVVVCTPTLGSAWGTGVIVGKTGLLLNNGTRIGSTSPYPDDVNYVRGGQIALLNNSPIIVMRDGKFFLSLGTPGGETIGQTQFQVLLGVLDFGMGIQEAIEAPRLCLDANPNFYKPGAEITMRVEGRVPPPVLARLKEIGHRPQATAEFAIGNMQGILRDPKTGSLTAGADPRRMMYAVGW